MFGEHLPFSVTMLGTFTRLNHSHVDTVGEGEGTKGEK